MYALICNGPGNTFASAPAGGYPSWEAAEKAGEQWVGQQRRKESASYMIIEIIEGDFSWQQDRLGRRFVTSESEGWAIATFEKGGKLPCYIFDDGDVMMPYGHSYKNKPFAVQVLVALAPNMWTASGQPSAPRKAFSGEVYWASARTGEVLVTGKVPDEWFESAGTLCDADSGWMIREATPKQYWESMMSTDGTITTAEGVEVFVR